MQLMGSQFFHLNTVHISRFFHGTRDPVLHASARATKQYWGRGVQLYIFISFSVFVSVVFVFGQAFFWVSVSSFCFT